jgi:amino acid adenylation domain-containing protein
MLPAGLVLLPVLPLTGNGKVDRRRLARLPIDSSDTAEGEGAAPRTATEEILAGLFAELLGRERVTLDDDFFALGGHSLLATRVVSRIRAVWGVDLPLRELFTAPTVRALARLVEGPSTASSGPDLAPRAEPEDGWPLSFQQERLWFLDQLEPGSAAYNIPAAFRMRGPLAAAALAASLREVDRRHGALRTIFQPGFRTGRQSAVQVVAPPGAWALPRIDLTGLPPERREGELARLAEREASTPFDLARGPLWRARLVVLAPRDRDTALLVTLHHIIGDGWSVGVLIREVVALYRAAVAGAPSPLPELAVQYTDFALWQRERLSEEKGTEEGGLPYWGRQLADVPVLVLPADRPRPAVQTFTGAQEPLRLGPARSRALLRFAHRQSATPFMVFLAGFATLLARCTAQDDFGIGTFVANRTLPQVEGLIGFFINNLALRLRLDGAPTFDELLVRARDTALDAYAAQDVPFEAVLEEVRPERSLSHPPLFQVMLVLQNVPKEDFTLAGVHLTRLPLESRRANFDLTLWLSEEEDGFAGLLDFNRDLFDPATIRRWAGHLQVLLDAVLAAEDEPGRRISQLPLLGAAERWQVVGEWSRGPAAPRLSGSVVELFARQAESSPEAVAVVAGGRHLTYGGLARAAAATARRLAGQGVGPEVPVGLAVERSPELLVGCLGILAAGGFYVPIDLSAPPERQAQLLADAGARVVVTNVDHGQAQTSTDERPFPPPHPNTLAYAIYTSGSTGKPKAVLVEHRSLAHHTADAAAFFALGPADRVLQFAAVSFDASAEEIWPCFARGATLVLRDDEMIASPRRFLDRCGREGITVLDLPTAYWHEIVAALAAGTATLPPCLRLVILGGEHAQPESWGAWRTRVGSRVRLVNTYGPTEATVVATRCDLSALPAQTAWREAPIGSPIAGTQAYVLAPDLGLLPAGIPGELCLGGAGLARCYLDRPDLTAERFVPDPLAAVPGARLYRTGDLARYRPDGRLELGGRIDQQVKVRGFRVEPGEVEAVLASHPEVAAAAVTVRDDLPGGRGLVAYLVPHAVRGSIVDAVRGSIVDAVHGLIVDAVHGLVAGRLPEYMIPAAWVVLSELPLRASGKVDRRALPAPALDGFGRGDGPGFVAPETPIGILLAEIWRDLLGHQRVGVHDNFFKLGGHSLLATRLVSQIHLALEVDLPLRTLFEAPTLGEMALAVEELVIARLDALSEEELASLE